MIYSGFGAANAKISGGQQLYAYIRHFGSRPLDLDVREWH
jgi:hypothetical protein